MTASRRFDPGLRAEISANLDTFEPRTVDVGERKPHPESLFLNCRELQCEPAQAIYVGDHLRDIEAGNRAGMHTIAAVYGYIEPGDDPYTWGADRHVEKSTELRDMIFG